MLSGQGGTVHHHYAHDGIIPANGSDTFLTFQFGVAVIINGSGNILLRIGSVRITTENEVGGKMDKTAASRLTAFCQMLHGSNVDGIRFCMVRFAIIGDGEGGGIDYNIRLYFLEKLFHRLAVAYIRTDKAIVARMGTDVVVQGTARCLVRQVAGQIIQDASAGKTVGAYYQYFLSCH